MKYSIAYNWDDALLRNFSELNLISKKNKIREVFASAAYSMFGCANAGLPEVERVNIEKKIKYAHSLGFSFNYLVNSISYPELKRKEDINEAINYFKWLKEMEVDSVTIANERVLKFVYENFPEMKINISIVMGVRTVDMVNFLRREYPSIQRVILHHTINRDKKSILEHVYNSQSIVGRSKCIEIELLANEICLYDCPRMNLHYKALSSISQNKDQPHFDWSLCGKVRSKNIRHFLNACWIRPEDVVFYENFGVNTLKLAGRKESTENLLIRASAYLNEQYNGNVMDLFLAEFWPDSKPPYIENEKLNGYVESLWRQNKNKLDLSEDVTLEYTFD